MPAVEDREFHAANGAHVADEAVGDHTCGATSARCRGQQLTPRRDALRAAAAEDHDIARVEIVDDPDLELVGIFAGRGPCDFAEQAGTRKADENKVVVKRADPRLHRLVEEADLVQDIRQHRGVEPPAKLDQEPVIAPAAPAWLAIDLGLAYAKPPGNGAPSTPIILIPAAVGKVLSRGRGAQVTDGSTWAGRHSRAAPAGSRHAPTR